MPAQDGGTKEARQRAKAERLEERLDRRAPSPPRDRVAAAMTKPPTTPDRDADVGDEATRQRHRRFDRPPGLARNSAAQAVTGRRRPQRQEQHENATPSAMRAAGDTGRSG
jgi:hypothetical protein